MKLKIFIVYCFCVFGNVIAQSDDDITLKVNETSSTLISPYTGHFLPSNDILFSHLGGYKQDDYRSQIKYFETGTFNNRFSKLRYDEYFKIYKNVETPIENYHPEMMDFSRGEGIFTSWRLDENDKFSYFRYHFFKDTFETFHTTSLEPFYRHIEDFNGNAEILLTALNNYYDQGYAEASPYRIITKNEEREIDGSFKHGVISHDGDHVLTINKNDLLEIRLVKDLTVVYSEQIVNPLNYRIYPDQETDFFISIRDQVIEIGKCNTYSLSLVLEEGKYTSKRQECSFVEDLSAVNKEVAFIFEGVGVRFRDRGIPYDFSNKPIKISLNKDATRLLVSYQKGSIKLYDTKDLTLLTTVYNPDKKSHLFYTPEGKYITNSDAGALLKATKNGVEIPFDQVPKSFYDPIAVLSTFGTLEKTYQETLEKSITVRNENTASQTGNSKDQVVVFINNSTDKMIVNDKEFELAIAIESKIIEPQISIKRNGVLINHIDFNKVGDRFKAQIAIVDSINIIDVLIKDKKGSTISSLSKRILYDGPPLDRDLYAIAIGVSDYEQDSHDLTFADKDALDFIAMYDTLQPEDQEAYFTNFYGKKYTRTSENETKQVIKNYNGDTYASSIDLIMVDITGRYWLENANKGTRLWDYNTGIIKEIKLSDGLKKELLSMGANSVVFPAIDGFYYSTKSNTVIKYNFLTGVEDRFKLPFDIIRGYNEGLVTLLDNSSWLLLELKNDTEDWNSQNVIQTIYTYDDKKWSSSATQTALQFNALRVLSSSKNGSKILFETHTDEIWLIDLDTSPVTQTRVLEEYNGSTLSEWYINESTITSSDKYTDKNYVSSFKITNYDFFGAIKKFQSIEDFSSIRGYGFDGDQTIFIKESGSVAKEAFSLKKESTKKTPLSFKNVYTTYLTNQNATQNSIHEVLNTFLKKAKDQDEIIIFLAGHGVLDKNLAYYYAPHNMDFNDVQKSGVAFNTIIDAMSQSKASKKLLLMDTCHSGNTLDLDEYEIKTSSNTTEGERGGKIVASKKGAGKTPKVSEIVSTLFDNFLSKNGATIISASSGQDIAYENKELSNGALTTAFIKQVKNQRSSYPFTSENLKPVSLTDKIITEIQKSVLQATNNKQVIDVKEINKLAYIKIW